MIKAIDILFLGKNKIIPTLYTYLNTYEDLPWFESLENIPSDYNKEGCVVSVKANSGNKIAWSYIYLKGEFLRTRYVTEKEFLKYKRETKLNELL